MSSQNFIPAVPPGLKNNSLYFQQDMRVPVTNISFVFYGAGIQQETEETAGLARMTSRMLLRGTRTMNRETISKKFELLGADISASVSETDFIISMTVFTRNLDAALQLLRDIIDDAVFPENELLLLKKQETNQFTAALQDPEKVLQSGHLFVVYGGTRLGKIGSVEAVAKISRDHIRAFFSNVRSCSVFSVSAISNLTEEELEKKLMVISAKRNVNGFSIKPEIPFQQASGRKAVIFNSKEAANDRLFWSHTGIAAADDRRFDLQLIIDALGSFEGYLFDVLRNKNGWCYGAYAVPVAGTLRPGRIAYYADPSEESSDKLIPELLKLIGSFGTDDGFTERLAGRNETFKNRYAYQLDLRYKLMSEVQRDRYGIPILSKEEYCSRIDAVSPQTAKKVIDDLFDHNNIFMIFFGDAPRLSRILKSIDPAISIEVHEKEELIR